MPMGETQSDRSMIRLRRMPAGRLISTKRDDEMVLDHRYSET